MLASVAFSTLLLVGMLVEPLAKRIHLPFSVLLVIIGFVGSEIIVKLGFDTGLRWHQFADIVLHILLPVLIFESAYNLNFKPLKKDLFIVLLLAIPLVVASTFIIGGLIHIGIGHSAGFPLIISLLAGAILSSTDPVAVIALFKKVGAPKRLIVLMEGESLFNDVASIVLYSIILTIALSVDATFDLTDSIVEFIRVLFGGLLAGTIIGFIALQLLRRLHSANAIGIVSISSVIFCIFIAEHIWHTSGVLAVLIAGLILGSAKNKHASCAFSQSLWEFFAHISNIVLFLLLGVTITVVMFTQQWPAMLAGIGAALITRVILIYGTIPVVNKLPNVVPVSAKYQAVMTWGALRGAVAVALALSLPFELEGWFTVQSIAYGVVLFTLLVQAPTLGWLIKKINLN